MAIDAQRPIVVKKIKKGGHGHHGGAWKIAYADFVTAMMAFFLLMWLLSSVNQAKLRGISDYFSTTVQAALFNTNGSGNRESIMDGGGADLSRPSGDSNKKVKEVPNVHGNKAPEALESDNQKKLKQAQSSQDQKLKIPQQSQAQKDVEKQQLKDLSKKIAQVIQANPDLSKLKDQIKLSMTPDGLRIQLMDQQNRPMFNSGSAVLQSYAAVLLQQIGKLLNNVPNQISITGHTDASPYAGSSRELGYSNWELSSDRANASRRELLLGGMQPDKVLRVDGMADAVPYDADNVFNPTNRRISITVLNMASESTILSGMGKTSGISINQLQDGAL